MDPNPILRRMGFTEDARVVIIHADDVGMCRAALSAFADLFEFGLVSSGSVMVPCPWFPQVAAYCRQHHDVDLGVHLTLTSEWEGYRWGPISTRDPSSGLLDIEGYFHRQSEAVQAQADPAAVQLEIEAQVDRALDAGIDVTHVDTHMGAVVSPKFMPGYVQLALQHSLPGLMLRLDEERWLEVVTHHEIGMDSETAAFVVQFMQELEAQGTPMLDSLASLPLDQAADRIALAKRTFDSLKSGLTHFIIHPAQDTPELRAIAPDWASRVGDYEVFMSEDLRDHIDGLGIHVIGYRALRELIKSS